MADLEVTLGGVVFPHLVFHLVFVYSNVEAVRICFSEMFEALAEGFESCHRQPGGYARLRGAVEAALQLGCTDAAAVCHLMAADGLAHQRPVRLMDAGYLELELRSGYRAWAGMPHGVMEARC